MKMWENVTYNSRVLREGIDVLQPVKDIYNDLKRKMIWLIWFDFWCLTPLSAIYQLYHGDQF
jgi:hypothetical protein